MKFSSCSEICTKRDPFLGRIFSQIAGDIAPSRNWMVHVSFFLSVFANKHVFWRIILQKGVGLCQRTLSTKRRKMFLVHFRLWMIAGKKLAEMDNSTEELDEKSMYYARVFMEE